MLILGFLIIPLNISNIVPGFKGLKPFSFEKYLQIVYNIFKDMYVMTTVLERYKNASWI